MIESRHAENGAKPVANFAVNAFFGGVPSFERELVDDVIARLTALPTQVEDPDGLVRFTLGDDGRLLSLFIDDAVRTPLTNLGLEKKLNDFWDSVGEGEGPV